MSARNLHRIMGSVFQHNKPGLCETCAHRRDYGDWEGYCALRGKILSVAPERKRKPRCEEYEAADDAAQTDRIIAGLDAMEEIATHNAWKWEE